MDDAPWIIAQNRYGFYCVPRRSAHRSSAKAALQGRVWESATVEFLRHNIGAGDVIHAGTYFGDFLPALSARLGPGGTVWAFEPNPENYHAACLTCRINRLSNVVLRNAALWGRACTRRIRVKDGNVSLGGGSRLVGVSEACPEADQLEVPAVTVDDVIPPDRHISLIQLDVEGSELEALSGARQIIKACKPLLLLETCPKAWIDENLACLGYGIAGAVNDNVVLSVNSRSLVWG